MAYKENKVAMILKFGSIILFIILVIGAFLISITENDLQVNVFFTSVTVSLIGCTLLYAFGELIEIEYEKKNIINKAIIEFKESKVKESK